LTCLVSSTMAEWAQAEPIGAGANGSPAQLVVAAAGQKDNGTFSRAGQARTCASKSSPSCSEVGDRGQGVWPGTFQSPLSFVLGRCSTTSNPAVSRAKARDGGRTRCRRPPAHDGWWRGLDQILMVRMSAREKSYLGAGRGRKVTEPPRPPADAVLLRKQVLASTAQNRLRAWWAKSRSELALIVWRERYCEEGSRDLPGRR